MPRLFIALATPPAVLPVMTAARDRLRTIRSDVKWEPDDKLHCTLKFLGDTRDDQVQPLKASLVALTATRTPIELGFGGLGAFPERGEPRIIWAGIRDTAKELARLAGDIDLLTASFGFERERRPFQPHVTLGRVKGQRGIRELLGTLETVTFDCPPVQIHEIVLVHSELRPSGSVYTVAARFALGARP